MVDLLRFRRYFFEDMGAVVWGMPGPLTSTVKGQPVVSLESFIRFTGLQVRLCMMHPSHSSLWLSCCDVLASPREAAT